MIVKDRMRLRADSGPLALVGPQRLFPVAGI